MASKEQIKDPTHMRWFIMRVDNPGKDSSVVYRISTGSWDTRYSKAMLWDNKKFAIQKANDLKRMEGPYYPGSTFVVGSCTVIDNAFDIGELV